MISDLFRIADNSGVVIEYCRLPLNKSVSAFDVDGNFILIDYSLINDGPEEYVHLAHELGHCETGSFYTVYASCDIRGKHETRANRWAIRQLVPREEFELAVRNGVTELWELADYFQVTEPFIQKAVEYYKMLETA